MRDLSEQELKDINGGVAPLVAAVCCCAGIATGVAIGALGVYYGYKLVQSML